MARRIVLGNHPLGYTGLFISKAGIDAASANPADPNPWLFSSQFDRVASVIDSGVCAQDTVVTHVDMGYIPYVFWERIEGTSIRGTEVYASNTQSSERGTRWLLQNLSASQFQINRNFPTSDTGVDATGNSFRYIVYSLPILG